MQEFTTLLLDCIEQELKSMNEHKSKFINKFTGTIPSISNSKHSKDNAVRSIIGCSFCIAQYCLLSKACKIKMFRHSVSK